MKENVANACNVDILSLNEINGNTDYKTISGTIVYDKKGNRHDIEHD